MESNILAQEKPKVFKLSDGKEYTLPPIDLTTLANLEQTLGFGLDKLGNKMESQPMTTIRAVIFALLKETYPGIDINEVGHLITIKEMGTISKTISEIMAVSM